MGSNLRMWACAVPLPKSRIFRQINLITNQAGWQLREAIGFRCEGMQGRSVSRPYSLLGGAMWGKIDGGSL